MTLTEAVAPESDTPHARGRVAFISGYFTAVCAMPRADYLDDARRQEFFQGWSEAEADPGSVTAREAEIARNVQANAVDAFA